jgi:hypothetical protein
MFVTLEIVAFCRPVESVRTWRKVRRAWRDPELEWVEGRTLLGCQFTFRGRDVHPRRGPKPRLLPNAMRRDGWGWWLDLRRVLVLAAWDDEQALARHEAAGPYPGACERWQAKLRPVKVRGSIRGEQRLPEMLETGGTDSLPGVVVTWNELPVRHFAAFRRRLWRIADQAHRSEGALASLSSGHFLGFPRFSAFTVSCWRTLGDAVAFAYSREPHRGVVRWYGRPHRFGEPWWGRFVIVRSIGTLAGRDPFEGLELAEAQVGGLEPGEPQVEVAPLAGEVTAAHGRASGR